MALHGRDVALVSLPGVVLFAALAGHPLLLAALEPSIGTVRLLSVGRSAAAAVAVGTAGAAGLAVGGDGWAGSAPALVFLGFLAAATVAAAAAGLLVWLVGPEGVSVGPAWQLLGTVLPHGVGVGFAGLAGAAVADLRAPATAAGG